MDRPSATSSEEALLNSYLSDTLESRMSQRAKSTVSQNRTFTGWKYIGIGIVLVIGAIASFSFFSNMESRPTFRRVNIIVAFLYMLGGKWLVLAVLGLGGIASTVAGILCLMGIIWIDDENHSQTMVP